MRWKIHTISSVTVGIPAASITRATSPTDRQQSGHTGASTARSTDSLAIPAAIAGAVSVSSTLVLDPW